MHARVLAAAVALFSLAGCAASETPERREAEVAAGAVTPVETVGSPGSHVGGHGMLLFGSEKLYLSHLPTFGPPHNIQVVVEAKIASPLPGPMTFGGTQNYSVRPAGSFSLFDLASGTLRSVKGHIHQGNFEQGGVLLVSNVTFEIVRVAFAQALLPATTVDPLLKYVAVGTPADPYLVHVIDARTSFDQIVKVTLPEGSAFDAAALERGTLLSVVGGVNSTAGRLRAGASVETAPLGAPPQSEDASAPGNVGLTVDGERSCLKGSGFGPRCTD